MRFIIIKCAVGSLALAGNIFKPLVFGAHRHLKNGGQFSCHSTFAWRRMIFRFLKRPPHVLMLSLALKSIFFDHALHA